MDGSLISLGFRKLEAKVLEISRPKKTLLDDLQLIREDILLIARIFIAKCPSVSYDKLSNRVFWVMHCIFVVVNYLRALETSSTCGCSHFSSALRGLEKNYVNSKMLARSIHLKPWNKLFR